MTAHLPDPVQQILADKAYGHVITFNRDHTPQLTMVWMDADGGEAVFNTADGRVKVRNLRRDPRIVVSVQHPHEPQSYVILHGRATIAEAGADEHIDRLAQRFLGVERYPFRQPGEKRLVVRITTERLGGFAPGMQPWR